MSSTKASPTDWVALDRDQARIHALKLAREMSRDLGTFEMDSEVPECLCSDYLAKHSCVGVFVSKKEWLEPAHFDQWILSASRSLPHTLQLCYPLVHENSDKSLEMSFEFLPTKEKAFPSLVFAPCTLADQEGNRMGRGKGCYDRYLSQHPQVQSIGVLHDDYLLHRFPQSWVHAHDRKVDALLTHKKFFRPEQKGETQS